MVTYKQLLAAFPTKSANQLLLTFIRKGQIQTVMVTMLALTIRLKLHALGFDMRLYSFHSFSRGDATAAYRVWGDQLDIKRHGLWSSEAFYAYITASRVSTSLVARALAVIHSLCV